MAYRMVNTADAMLGYRGRLEHLGKVAAVSDDILNLAPARIAAGAIAFAAPCSGGSTRASFAALACDGGRTASPNAGRPMAAAAGALGIWLEKLGHYRLGSGREPHHTDIERARWLTLVAAALFTVGLIVLSERL
jgi:adenosylcobinamide-phosphate synthase